MHEELLNAPVPLLVNDTDPVGALAVPVEVSVTAAVHVEPWPTATVAGTQLTAVVVLRRATVSEAVPELPA